MFGTLLISNLDEVSTVVPGEAGIGAVVTLGDVVLVEIGDGGIVLNLGCFCKYSRSSDMLRNWFPFGGRR